VPAIRAARCWPSARDAIAVLVAAGLAGAAMWPFRDLASPWLALVGAGTAGVIIFAAVLVAFDVLGLRGAVRARLAGARPQAEGGAP